MSGKVSKYVASSRFKDPQDCNAEELKYYASPPEMSRIQVEAGLDWLKQIICYFDRVRFASEIVESALCFDTKPVSQRLRPEG